MQKYETECMFYWVRVPKVQNSIQKYTKIKFEKTCKQKVHKNANGATKKSAKVLKKITKKIFTWYGGGIPGCSSWS